jgi:membrane-bound lytic murein transglycosylase D
MSRTLKKFALSALLCAGIPSISFANDISLYSPPFSAVNSDTYAFRTFNLNNDVWTRIRKGFGMSDLLNERVVANTEWYASRPDYIQRTTDRASRYLYHVVEELEKRNMPMELALLPFIESAFNPQAYSTARAAGMWQFIPSTGLYFNLKQNMFTDERRNVLASTDAALTYLEKLYDMFGDWHLALAAYNWGEGAVQRAMNKNRAAGKPTDYESLADIMPLETRNYVPKLQAVKNIIAAPDEYGITLPLVQNQPYFVTIEKTRNIDLAVAAQLAEMSLEEFKALNPQFNRPVIVAGKDTQILLPESHAEKFKHNLEHWTEALSSWTSHTIQGGRVKIAAIAEKFGTTEEVIRQVNNIPPRMVLKAGSTILVPTTAVSTQDNLTAEVAERARVMFEPDGPATRLISVKVQRNDSLKSLAKRHNVSIAQLKQWNNIKSNTLASGQTLEIHVPVRTRTAKSTTRVTTQPAKKAVQTKKVSSNKSAANGKPIALASNKRNQH